MGCSSARPLIALALLGAAAPDAATISSLRALAAADLRVAGVAYRLQTVGVPACRDIAPLPGLIVQDAAQYRADLRPVAARLFHLAQGPAVTGVVPDGPAARAGLAAGDEIVAIDGGNPIAGLPRPRAAADGARATALAARLAAAFARGPVRFTVARGGERRSIVVTGAPACASLVQLGLGVDRNAAADGRTVTVSRGLLDFVVSDDELAFVIAHELAHNILRQPQAGASPRSEEQADTLGLHLVAWAGYDVDAAMPFWQRLARSGDAAVLFPDGSHPPGDERIAAIDRTARAIRAALVAGRRPEPDAAPD